jgi:hypothetical protein
MKIEQLRWTKAQGWMPKVTGNMGSKAHLVLAFGAKSIVMEGKLLHEVQTMYPKAILFGCSTSGEIYDTQVTDDSLVITAIHFDQTTIAGSYINLEDTANSFDAGKKLAEKLNHQNLKHLLVLSDGVSANGSDLVKGLVQHLPSDVTITGGLAGDGANFNETMVVWNKEIKKNMIAVLGLYGNHIKIGFGSLGGWDPFGPQRLVTRSKDNILYELDGFSALDLYKKYLGEHAKDLPVSGLRYPLCLRTNTNDVGVVRTILSVNEKDNSLLFAGDIPEGAYAQLMMANFDRLIDGASGAARTCVKAIGNKPAELALLISCVGRKLVLKQRIEEEVESVREVFGPVTLLTGFYSNGEISAFTPGAQCALHNQTMTITTFLEE